jgi:hypothetical protein
MLNGRIQLLSMTGAALLFTTAGCGSSGEDPAPNAGGPTTLSAKIGPIHLETGEEHTRCITVNLKNPEGSFIRRFRTSLEEGSHHLVLYRSDATAENLTPTECAAFSGLIKGQPPLFIAQQKSMELVMPNDENGIPTGLEIRANQMVDIEIHSIDTTSGPLDVSGDIQLDTVPLSTNIVKSDILLFGTLDIKIPANGEYDTGVKFHGGLPGTKAFAVTTHQHHLGTEMQVWYSTSIEDTKTRVADGKVWSDPAFETFSPALDFPAKQGQDFSDHGLSYQCHWKNTTAKDVGFGESANDEMCLLWAYYYPSIGFETCIDGLPCRAPVH